MSEVDVQHLHRLVLATRQNVQTVTERYIII
jgi:hypothetical protein